MKKFTKKMNMLQMYSRVNVERKQNVEASTKSFETPQLCLWGSDYFNKLKAGIPPNTVMAKIVFLNNLKEKN